MIRSAAVPDRAVDSTDTRSTATGATDATDASSAEQDAPARARSTLGLLAGPLCLVLLSGLAMPPHHGLLVPLVLVLAMAIVGERRLRGLLLARAALTEGAGHPVARVALLAVALGSVAVLSTVLARSVGTLLVEVPASLWGAGAAAVAALAWALVGARLSTRARPVVLVLLALAIPWAGVVGTRYEAAGPHAHGSAHSGPILGIHPFQITSIVVDGEGPFDLPINDYVEPDGSRGYGPEALADALDRALASIADRVYAVDGPQGSARMRRALLDAEVEAVVTPGVWERLDRAPTEETQPRFVVRSGSFGRGSRVEFVCPGRRIDPRGPQGETVMSRMCPDKYASEASAGLGVTGRWSGYSEARGQDRVGLHALLGLTRGNDAEGRRVLEREIRLWAWLVLALVAAVVLVRPAVRAGEGLRGVGGALGVLAVVGLGALAVGAAVKGEGGPQVGVLPAGPSWMGWPSLAALAPALVLGSLGLFALEEPPAEGGAAAPRARTAMLAAPAVLVTVSTLALAAFLPALAWIFPLHGSDGLLVFVRGVAEALGERAGLTIFEIEGAVAGALVSLLLGGAVATAGAGGAAAARLWPFPRARSVRHAHAIAMVVVLVVAALLVVSRKTAGAAALVPAVVGATLVLGGSLLRLASPPTGPEAPHGRSHGRSLGRSVGRSLGWLAPIGWATLGAGLVGAAVDPLPSHPFVVLYTVLGLLAVIAAGAAGAVGAGARPDPDPTLERRGARRL